LSHSHQSLVTSHSSLVTSHPTQHTMKKKVTLLLSFLISCSLYATIHTVEALEAVFEPSELNIALGDTIRFVWIEGNHAIVSGTDGIGDGAFETFPLNEASPEFDLILTFPGEYNYFCAFHYESDGTTGVIQAEGNVQPITPCSQLFFSEYIEGSANNKALEIYNPRTEPVDLSDYLVKRFSNGATVAGVVDTLEGTIEAGGVFLIVSGSADSVLLSKADYISNTITAFNGNDALSLQFGNQTVDIIGQIGEDPGDAWMVGNGATEENTLIRKPTIRAGQLFWSVGATEWDVFPQDYFQDIGFHSNLFCTSIAPESCSELFFSEYIEGSDNNAALEIFNPTNTPIDLTEYTVEIYNNGSNAASTVINLFGELGASGAYVIVKEGASTAFTNLADLFADLTYSGDDAVALKKGNDFVDAIGMVGSDPGVFWQVGDGSTEGHSLVRKFEVEAGANNWSTGETQWDVFDEDYIDNLGTHSSVCGSTSVSVSFSGQELNFPESEGMVELMVFAQNASDVLGSVDVVVAGGSAENGTDYIFMETTLEFDNTTPMPMLLDLEIVDDAIEEDVESFTIQLQNPSDGVELVNDDILINIIDNDVELPVFTIAEVTTTNTNGTAESLGTLCELTGTVYGVNLRPADDGLQFMMRDETGGIAVFSFQNISDYTVSEGDNIRVMGEIDQFKGLIQISPFQIEVLSQNNALKTPTLVTSLGEDTELDLIRMECVSIPDDADWPNVGGGFNITLDNGAVMRIDDQVDIFGGERPNGTFNLIGIGWQDDTDGSTPYNDGYQILPRYVADIELAVPDADFTYEGDELTFTFTADNPNATGYAWNFGDGNGAEGATATHTFSSYENYEVSLSVTGDGVCGTENTYTEVVPLAGVGLQDITNNPIQCYPNPTYGVLNIESEAPLQHLRFVDLTGKTMLQQHNITTQKHTIEVTDLPKGMYLLHLKTTAGEQVKKVHIF